MSQGKVLSILKIRNILSLILINYSYSCIVSRCKVSKSTIEKYRKLIANTEIKNLDQLIETTDEDLVKALYGDKAVYERKAFKGFIKVIRQIPSLYKKQYLMIDTQKYLEKILSDPMITISDIYKDYINEAKEVKKEHFKSTAFRNAMKKELEKIKKQKLSMHRTHEYGNELELDWCGTTVKLKHNGKSKKYYVLVLTWAASYYCFATLVEDLGTKNATKGIGEGLKYFGIKPNILLIDNARALVIKHKFGHEAILNESFNHYMKKCSVVVNANNPGRANEKSAVEHSVRMIQERVLHKLEKDVDVDIAKIQLQVLINKYINDAPFRMSNSITRTFLFDNYEKKKARKIFKIPEYCNFISNKKVSTNYHIKILGNYYSVPSEYAGKFVDAEIQDDFLKILSDNKEICVHILAHENEGKYITNSEHMPENHKAIYYKDSLFSDPRHIFSLVKGLSNEVLAFCLVFFNSKHSFSEIKKACSYVIKKYKELENDKDRENFNMALKNILLREEEIEKVNTYTLDQEIKLLSIFS